ncbi:hypothetical protein MT_57068 [Pseudomonas phage phiPto-bp6g]|nr:hypothetical protein MT_57068 [Pseudomonas phage phiPto-bp6g]
MKYVLGFLTVVALAMVAFFMIMLYVVVNAPTCSERGGVDVADGVVITNVTIGKVMIPQITQSYKCVIP